MIGTDCPLMPRGTGRNRTCDTRFRSSIRACSGSGRQMVRRPDRDAGVCPHPAVLMSLVDVRSHLTCTATGVCADRARFASHEHGTQVEALGPLQCRSPGPATQQASHCGWSGRR